MRYRYPHYYKQFQCIAQECEATCCAGWEIVIDEASIENYLAEKSEFGNRLCNSIDFTEEVFHQDEKKRCAFLNEENLCDIYSELGEDALCYTCTQYPRHIEEFEEINEVSLSISCPVVAEMILSMEDKVTFYEDDQIEEIEPFEEFDFLFYELLCEVREIIYQIIQNRNWNIDNRMAVAEAMIADIQEKINTYEIFAIDEVIQKYESMNSEQEMLGKQKDLAVHYSEIQASIMELYQLEVLQDEWRPYLLETQMRLYDIPYIAYREAYLKFRTQYQSGLERMKEQLMMYFLYSYLCGAVYDGEVQAKYLLAHRTTQIVEELWFAKYMENDGTITEKEMQCITYRYAREIEHSDENLDILESLYQVS